VVGLLGASAAGIALFVPAVRTALASRGFVSNRSAVVEDGDSAASLAAKATSEEVRGLRVSVERLADAVRALSDRSPTDDAGSRFEALESRLIEASRRDSEAIGSLEGSIGDIAALLGELRGEIDAVKMLASIPSGDLVDDGGDAAPDAPVSSPDENSAGPSPLPPGEPSASPDRDRWIAELSASDSGRRFTAIVELARLRDPAAVSELGKSLASDPDVYCRTEAARTLGEFRAVAAVPFLIAALRDREGMVAVTAAESLKLITTKSFGFTNKATPQERREAISRWESWWEKNKDSAPGSGASKH
jgi:HEAT repeat protein